MLGITEGTQQKLQIIACRYHALVGNPSNEKDIGRIVEVAYCIPGPASSSFLNHAKGLLGEGDFSLLGLMLQYPGKYNDRDALAEISRLDSVLAPAEKYVDESVLNIP